MNHTVEALIVGGALVLLIEAVQAVAMRHVKRLGICALIGAGVAGLIGVFADVKRHAKLAATAAAHHETAAHIMVPALGAIAVIVTVVAYGVATWRDRRGGSRTTATPRGSW